VSIWHAQPDVARLNRLHEKTLVALLGIEIAEIGDDFLRATMPVDQRTKQPFGLLHGGASVVLAETLASVAGNQVVDNDRFQCVGVTVAANHLRGARSGVVIGTARPGHLGRRTHVWDIDIRDGEGRSVSVCRATLAVVPR